MTARRSRMPTWPRNLILAPALDAGDVRPAVEQRGQLAGRVDDLAGEHGVVLDRPDLDRVHPALHRGPAGLGQRPDRPDPGRRGGTVVLLAADPAGVLRRRVGHAPVPARPCAAASAASSRVVGVRPSGRLRRRVRFGRLGARAPAVWRRLAGTLAPGSAPWRPAWAFCRRPRSSSPLARVFRARLRASCRPALPRPRSAAAGWPRAGCARRTARSWPRRAGSGLPRRRSCRRCGRAAAGRAAASSCAAAGSRSRRPRAARPRRAPARPRPRASRRSGQSTKSSAIPVLARTQSCRSVSAWTLSITKCTARSVVGRRLRAYRSPAIVARSKSSTNTNTVRREYVGGSGGLARVRSAPAPRPPAGTRRFSRISAGTPMANTTTTSQAPSVNFTTAKMSTTTAEVTPAEKLITRLAPPGRLPLRGGTWPCRTRPCVNAVNTPIA